MIIRDLRTDIAPASMLGSRRTDALDQNEQSERDTHPETHIRRAAPCGRPKLQRAPLTGGFAVAGARTKRDLIIFQPHLFQEEIGH
jgi:hypothetical protein